MYVDISLIKQLVEMAKITTLEHERTFLVGQYIYNRKATLLCYSYCSILHQNMFDDDVGIEKILHTGTGLYYTVDSDRVSLPEVKITHETGSKNIEKLPKDLLIGNCQYMLDIEAPISIQHFVRGKYDKTSEKVQNLVSILFSLISYGKESEVEDIIDTLLSKDTNTPQKKGAINQLLEIVTEKDDVNILITNLMVACMYITGNYYDVDLKYFKPNHAILKCFKILTSVSN